MIYPIVLIGDPVLKTKAEDIEINNPEINSIIDNMYETMHNAHGVGLAAPQVGKSIRLFVVDASSWEDEPEVKDFKQVFINARITEYGKETWKMEEGCLSIPGMRESVQRPESITIQYICNQLRSLTTH